MLLLVEVEDGLGIVAPVSCGWGDDVGAGTL